MAPFSPDDKELWSASDNELIVVWDAARGEVARRFGLPGGFTQLAFSPDGKLLLSDNARNEVRTWRVDSLLQSGTFSRHSSYIDDIVFSTDSRWVATRGLDGLYVWDVASGNLVPGFEGQNASVANVAFSPEGKQILLGLKTGQIMPWNVQLGRAGERFQGKHEGRLKSIFMPREDRAVSVGTDGAVRLWDAASGKQIKAIETGLASAERFAAASDGRRFVASLNDDTIRVYDLEQSRELKRYRVGGRVESLAISHSQDSIVTGDQDGHVRTWKMPASEQDAGK